VLIEKLESGKEVYPSVFTDLSGFLQTFGNRCHHAKEEEHLFKVLEKKGVPVSGMNAYGHNQLELIGMATSSGQALVVVRRGLAPQHKPDMPGQQDQPRLTNMTHSEEE